MQVFLSYSTEDLMQTMEIRDLLESQGISCWIAKRNILPGSDYAIEIPNAINKCDVFLLILTPSSQKSQYVRRELEWAVKKGKRIIPFALYEFELDAPIEFHLQHHQRINVYELGNEQAKMVLWQSIQVNHHNSDAQNIAPDYLGVSPSQHQSHDPNQCFKKIDPSVPNPTNRNIQTHSTVSTNLETQSKQPSRNIRGSLWIKCIAAFLSFAAIASCIIWYQTSPQREISKEADTLFKQALEMVDISDYNAAIDLLNKINTEWEGYEKVDTVRQDIQRRILLEQFEQGVFIYNEEKLINLIREIIPDPDNDPDIAPIYQNAIIQYERNKLEEAAIYAEQGEFLYAKSVLRDIERLIGSSFLLEQMNNQIDIQSITAQVLSYADTENYEDAIILLNENSAIVASDSELQVKLNLYQELFRQNAVNEAARTYESDGCASAISVLNNALNVLPNDPIILEKMERYKAAVPVPLTSLNVLKQGDIFRVGEYIICPYEDVSGNQYSAHSVHWMSEIAYSLTTTANERVISYFLNQEYDSLTGILYRPYISLLGDEAWTSDGTVIIYGDGAVLYEGSVSQNSWDPIHIKANVSGVRELKIEINGFWRIPSNEPAFGYDWYSKCCLAEMEVSKKP